MRMYGPGVGPVINLNPTLPHGVRTATSRRSEHRRLDDAMVAVFERACNTNNLDAAADVLEVLLLWHRRRATKYGRERRINDDHLQAMLAELQRLTVLRKV